jgi:uncharacterized protein
MNGHDPARRPRPRRGLYEDEFWRYVQEGAVRLQRSPNGRFRYPPSAVDPETLDPNFEWVPIQGTGTLLAWTVFHRQYLPGLPTPYTVAAVRTTEGPVLVANVVDADPHQLAHGMDMVLRYEAAGSAGDEWQIFQWTPAASRAVPTTTEEHE